MIADPELDTPESDWDEGSAELNQRQTFRLLFNEPRIRNYVFAAFGSLAMIFLIMFEQGSDIGGMLIVVLGACGVLLRFRAAPVLMLLIVTYFMWSPFGVPDSGYSSVYLIEERRFHFLDVILVMSLLVYCASQYRLYGLVYQAIAFEGPRQGKDEPRIRRPASLIRPAELATLLAISVGLVIAGQLIWLIATSLEITPADPLPLRVEESRPISRPLRTEKAGVLSPPTSRFFVLLGMLFFGTLLARLVFGYWRLRTMGPAEARMMLLDTGWSETHRERVRLEKWRAWGRKRAQAHAQKADKTGSKS